MLAHLFCDAANKMPYIIAEIASAHEGKPELALKIANHAINAGADAVKFQMFNRDELLTKSNPYYEEFGEIEIEPGKWHYILKKIASLDIDIIVEAFDIRSLSLAEKSGFVHGYKVPAANISDYEFLKLAGQTQKPVYLGVGGAGWKEIEQAVKLFEQIGKTELVMMCGFQNFPTKLKDSKLSQIQRLKEAFQNPVGFADHVDAENKQMAVMVPALAVASGCSVIEKHITDDRSNKGKDYYSSLNPDEFREFVALMRQLPDIIGTDSVWKLSEAEKKYRSFTKKQAVAVRDIDVGTVLIKEDVVYKRTNTDGLSQQDIVQHIGEKFVQSKQHGEPLTHEDFNG